MSPDMNQTQQGVITELNDQIAFLRRPEVRWVKYAPRYPMECCAVVRIWENGFPYLLGGITVTFIDKQLAATLGWVFISTPVWNDAMAENKGQVIEVLEKARAAAEEQVEW